MAKRRRKKMSLYKKSLLLFAIVLLLIGEACLIYVTNSVKAYELGNVNTYMDKLVKDVQKSSIDGNAKKYFVITKVSNDYEKKSSMEEGYKELFKDAKVTYKKADKLLEKYDIYADDYKVATVELTGKEVHKLGILTFNEWSIKNFESVTDEGVYNVDIVVPSGYKVKVNNIDIKKENLVSSDKIKHLEEAYSKVDLITLDHYKISNLTHKPTIVVNDASGKKVDVTENNNLYEVTFKKVNEEDVIKKSIKNNFDPWTFAEDYSKFMTRDLSGERYGLYNITARILPGTELETAARKWATGVDIRFTSSHSSSTVKFSDKVIKDYIFYSDNAFSVYISFTKEFVLSSTGQKIIDKTSNRYFFVYTDGSYKCVKMINEN